MENVAILSPFKYDFEAARDEDLENQGPGAIIDYFHVAREGDIPKGTKINRLIISEESYDHYTVNELNNLSDLLKRRM